MAKVSIKDIAEMKDDQLVHYIKDSREELFNLRFRHATGELENSSAIKEAKKALARGLTVANKRSIDVKSEIQRG
jgi:large subunit ribosomal protein L29